MGAASPRKRTDARIISLRSVATCFVSRETLPNPPADHYGLEVFVYVRETAPCCRLC
jgi:hypothetical protein